MAAVGRITSHRSRVDLKMPRTAAAESCRSFGCWSHWYGGGDGLIARGTDAKLFRPFCLARAFPGAPSTASAYS